MDFYRTPRGYHKRAVNSNSGEHGWIVTNPISFINMSILAYASEMRTPTLIVAGEKAHSRYFLARTLLNRLATKIKS